MFIRGLIASLAFSFGACATDPAPVDYGAYVLCVNHTDGVAYDAVVYQEKLLEFLTDALHYYDECNVSPN